MKTFNRFLFSLLFVLAALTASAQQNSLTNTTLAAAMDATQNYAIVTSATNLTSTRSLFVDGELMPINSQYNGTSTNVPLDRLGGKKSGHVIGATVISGRGNWFHNGAPFGACVAANTFVGPWVNTATGDIFRCGINGQWGLPSMFKVAPTQCTFAPTTLTTTNTYVQVGASNAFVLNGVSNAAAGTQTLVCDFALPTEVTTGRGSILTDIVVTIGSQVLAPTSLGTSTLGTVTFPAPVAVTQTASVVTPVAIGGTVTTLGPTTTVATVTTAGAFLTFLHTYSTLVELNTDIQSVHYTFPILQSAASAMTLNTTGLMVHYQRRN
jgi:hypothetical protein